MQIQAPVGVATNIERQFNTLAPDAKRSAAVAALRGGTATLQDLRTVHARLGLLARHGETTHIRKNAIRAQNELWAMLDDATQRKGERMTATKKTMIQEETEQYPLQDLPTAKIDEQIETARQIKDRAQYTVERATEVMAILQHELDRRGR